jgi:hypothetical protein
LWDGSGPAIPAAAPARQLARVIARVLSPCARSTAVTTQQPSAGAPLEALAFRKRQAADRRDRQAAELRRQAKQLEDEGRRRRAAAKETSV